MRRDLAIPLIETNKLNNSQLLDIGEKTRDESVWQRIALRLNYGEYLGNQLIIIGRRAHSLQLWMAMLAKFKFTAD